MPHFKTVLTSLAVVACPKVVAVARVAIELVYTSTTILARKIDAVVHDCEKGSETMKGRILPLSKVLVECYFCVDSDIGFLGLLLI